MVNKIVVGVLAVMVASIVLIASLPIYGGLSETSVIVENEGAGELRFSLADNHAEYSISVTWGDDNITVANGTDTQAISYDNPTILYADENLAVWYDGNDGYILAPEGDGYATETVADDMTIVKNSSGLSVTIGEGSPVSYSAPAWAYIANSAGKYGYFEDGTEIKTPTNNRLAVVGSFAGVYCYNQYNNYDLPISLELTQEGNVLSGAKWVKALQEPDTALEPLDPGSITPLDPGDISITPLDPGDISITPLDPEPDVSIKAVPTPTYTEGDWGYDVVNGTTAKIVSYSGTGGDITIPSTVGGYPVTQIGKDGVTGNGSNYVMTNAQLTADTTLTIPSGVTVIGAGAFQNSLSKLVGVNLPDGISIGRQAFFNSGLKSIVIPDNATVYSYVYHSCSQATSLTIGENVTFQEGNTFKNCLRLDGTVIIPATTTYGTYTSGLFEGCSGVDSFIFPDDMIDCYTRGSFFYNCSGWVKDDLIIYDGVVTVGYENFRYCSNITGKLIIPESVKTVSSGSFYGMSKIDTLISLMDNDSVINSNSFSSTTNLKTILNLGSLELTTTSYGLNADTIRSDIPALGYISAVEFTDVEQAEGAVYDLLNLVPLLSVFGLVLGAIVVFLIRRV